MTGRENLKIRILKLEQNLQDTRKSVYMKDPFSGEIRVCFPLKDKSVARLSSIGHFNAIVVEYADTEALAQKGIFGEDGDLFYIDEMDMPQMLAAIEKELDD